MEPASQVGAVLSSLGGDRSRPLSAIVDNLLSNGITAAEISYRFPFFDGRNQRISELSGKATVYLSGNIPTRIDAACDWALMGETLWLGFSATAMEEILASSVFIPAISTNQTAAEAAVTQTLLRFVNGELPIESALAEATRPANFELARGR